MVENKKLVPHKHAEVIKAWADGEQIQYYDGLCDKWLDIDDPDWCENQSYRVKPEVVKPKWPESTMSDKELQAVMDNPDNHEGGWDLARDIANAAIAHALETGLVVLPNIVTNTAQVDYKKDIEDWGSNALSEAAREFISKQDKHYVLSCSGAVGIKAAILKYLECVEKEVV